MSAPRPTEEQLLKPAEALLRELVSRHARADMYAARLSILEGAAARLGGFSVAAYQSAFEVDPLLSARDLEEGGAKLAAALSDAGIHPSLALSALAREPMSVQDRRATGAHHTDFRLAGLLGRRAADLNPERRPIIDPACGAGILLVGTTLAMFGSDRTAIGSWLAESVNASDVSEAALRGTRLALASMTDDLAAIATMSSKWQVGDSLLRDPLSWPIPHDGFGAVVANPPWEKVKISRHEQAVASGKSRNYGQSFDEEQDRDLFGLRADKRDYASELGRRYPSAASGEMDLYAAFTELMVTLSGKSGGIAALVPAGLIRSQGTRQLRDLLIERFGAFDVTMLDNKARFFAIDTRFKFLLLSASGTKRSGAGRIGIAHAVAGEREVTPTSTVSIPCKTLKSIRPDLTIPEVRSNAEWRLFSKMAGTGHRMGVGGIWNPKFSREVDMTKERRHFVSKPRRDALPVVEGRMVQHHRLGAKSYVCGEGRSATWRPNPIGDGAVKPQFWIPAIHVPRLAFARTRQERVGFCDIAGQTNERSMSTAIIPPGLVCGNKVPTVLFEEDPHGSKARLWCGLVNSFAFDWMLRRVLTTTVNYFLLESIPLPPILPDSLPGRRIVDAVLRIEALDRSGTSDAAWKIAEQRLLVDGLCFRALGLGATEVSLILDDFTSLDRSQPKLPGETRSTITRDFILAQLGSTIGIRSSERLARYRAIGAVPYVPSQNGEDQERFQAIA
ncbi:Eco57I restriction-modification methylase domain-containing protein [Sphingomonas sp. ac-8]|uniref:Eco57I restriction-modification methylase domain-containing protein n=1 Tax=Sphingomonas sp. ac-8 TaxID=3242977 RepID=UPI003A80EF67